MADSLFATFQTGITGFGEFVLELFDSAGRVDEFQFARVKRMTLVTDIDLQFFARAASCKGIATATGDLGIVVFGMDFALHGW